MTSQPVFTAPNLAERLKNRIEDDPGNARIYWGLPKNPDAKWLPKAEEGLKAAQREIDDWASKLDVSEHLENAAVQQIGEEKLAELRRRVRVKEDATLNEVILAVLQGQWLRLGVLLCPLHKPIGEWVHWSHMALMRANPFLSYDQVTFPVIAQARNMLAQQFLRTEAEWSFWLDGDTVAPMGNAAFLYHRCGFDPTFIKPEFAGLNAFLKMSSRQKTVVGGIVVARDGSNRLVIQPELNPRDEADKKLVMELKKEGAQDKVVPVGYAGTGCLMVHRSVYLDIMKRRPDLMGAEGEPFNFFGGQYGEDIAFCKLAEECGHPSHLDLSIWCAHFGPHMFAPRPEI